MFVAGTTTAADFPVKNAAQGSFGEARLLRTTDLGATWSKVNAPADLLSVVPDPVDPQTLFALSDDSIYKTADGGRTWRTVYRYPASMDLSLAIDPGNHQHVAATAADPAAGPMRSLDGGDTWIAGGTCPVYYCSGQLTADPTGSGALLVRGHNRISPEIGA